MLSSGEKTDSPADWTQQGDAKSTVRHVITLCSFCCRNKTRWLPTLVFLALVSGYAAVLTFYGRAANTTIQVSRMIKAERCYVDHIGHKSGSRKTVRPQKYATPLYASSISRRVQYFRCQNLGSTFFYWFSNVLMLDLAELSSKVAE